jgi:hypothetical protein
MTSQNKCAIHFSTGSGTEPKGSQVSVKNTGQRNLKRRVLLFLGTAFAGTAVLGACANRTAQHAQSQGRAGGVSYRVAQSFHTAERESVFVIRVSIDRAKNDRQRLTELAARLRRDYAAEPRIYAIVFNDRQAAKKWEPGWLFYERSIIGQISLDGTTRECFMYWFPDPKNRNLFHKIEFAEEVGSTCTSPQK